jgi:hypothetical protein
MRPGRLDERGDLSVLRVFTCRKPSHHADTVNLRTVLAYLALAFKPRDRDLHPDDASQMRGDEIDRGVSNDGCERRLCAAAHRLSASATAGIIDVASKRSMSVSAFWKDTSRFCQIANN